MRLIDADEMVTGIEELKISPWATEEYMAPHRLTVKDALENVRYLCIEQAPTIDAVPVVRCKDCRRLVFSDCYGECGMGYLGIVNPWDYCSHGERKEQEG